MRQNPVKIQIVVCIDGKNKLFRPWPIQKLDVKFHGYYIFSFDDQQKWGEVMLVKTQLNKLLKQAYNYLIHKLV